MRYRRPGRGAETTLLALGRTAAVLLGIQIALAPAADADEQRGANHVQTEPARTIKERLSGKASDDQRVDDCKVPVELRGPKPRPDCPDDAETVPKR